MKILRCFLFILLKMKYILTKNTLIMRVILIYNIYKMFEYFFRDRYLTI